MGSPLYVDFEYDLNVIVQIIIVTVVLFRKILFLFVTVDWKLNGL